MAAEASSIDCEVLLATYNGSEFLAQFLDSLLAQDEDRFRIIARDDGSTDTTREILARYSEKFAGRMQILSDATPSGSAAANFDMLLRSSSARHVLFADQDDIWRPARVRRTIEELLRLEKRYGRDCPLYFFTDVEVIDRSFNQIAESYWAFKKIDPGICKRLSQILVCPPMLGCASGINRKLADMITPLPVGPITGHDWYALLVARLFGQIGWSAERTVRYRVHGGNSSRPKEARFGALARHKRWVSVVRRGMLRRREQAAALLDTFGPAISETDRRVIEGFIRSGEQSFLGRRLKLVSGKYLYPDATRNFAMLTLC